MAYKEILHISRDVRFIYMALGMPVVLLLLFGYAISFDLDLLPVGLLDQDQTPESRHFGQSLTSSNAFRIATRLTRADEIEPLFRQGEIQAALVIPKGYGKAIRRGETARAQMILDGANGTTASIALGYSQAVSQAESRHWIEQSGQMPRMAIDGRIRARFNPGMESARFIVPGVIALILAIMGVLLTALTVAREWERGSMEQLFTTPVGRLEIILGKLLPYMVIGMVQVLLVVTVGTTLFALPVRGSLGLLFFASALFLTGMLGQGLLLSVITRSQMISTQAGLISAMLPTILLSGFVLPIENMPWPLQLLSYIVPGRYYIRVLRGVLLKGNGLDVLWPQLLLLSAFALLMVIVSTARFRRRLD